MEATTPWYFVLATAPSSSPPGANQISNCSIIQLSLDCFSVTPGFRASLSERDYVCIYSCTAECILV